MVLYDADFGCMRLRFIIAVLACCASACRDRENLHQAFHADRRKPWTAKLYAFAGVGSACSIANYIATPEGAAALSDFERRVAARVEQDLQQLRDRADAGRMLIL